MAKTTIEHMINPFSKSVTSMCLASTIILKRAPEKND